MKLQKDVVEYQRLFNEQANIKISNTPSRSRIKKGVLLSDGNGSNDMMTRSQGELVIARSQSRAAVLLSDMQRQLDRL